MQFWIVFENIQQSHKNCPEAMNRVSSNFQINFLKSGATVMHTDKILNIFTCIKTKNKEKNIWSQYFLKNWTWGISQGNRIGIIRNTWKLERK